MTPLTTTEVLIRMRQVDAELASIANEYGDCAARKTEIGIDRDKAFADAYMVAEGNSIDRRQAARAAIGTMGKDEDKAYARVAADFEIRASRAVLLESMLKKSSDDDPRYRQ